MQASDGREIVTIVLSPVERRGNGSRDFVRTIDNGLLLSRNIISANSIGSLDPLRRILERAALELAFLHEVEATSIWGPRTDSFWLSYAGGCKFFWILDGIFWNRCRQAGRVEIELGYFEEAGIRNAFVVTHAGQDAGKHDLLLVPLISEQNMTGREDRTAVLGIKVGSQSRRMAGREQGMETEEAE
jgi:hypothetical protein